MTTPAATVREVLEKHKQATLMAMDAARGIAGPEWPGLAKSQALVEQTDAALAALTALEQDRDEAKRALETALIGSSMLVNSAKEQGIEWRADGPGATMVCHNTRAEQAEAALAWVRHQVHKSDDVMDCSFSYGGPNYRDEDGERGVCTYAPHWRECDHCAERLRVLYPETRHE